MDINGAEINGAEINGSGASSRPDIVAPRGQTVTVYRCIITGEPDVTVPIRSFQARSRYGESSFLQCVIPAANQWIDDIEERSEGDIIIEAGARFPDGATEWTELLRADLSDVQFTHTARGMIIVITGYRSNVFEPREVTIAPGSYQRRQSNSAAYRLPDVDFNVRPGDLAHLPDGSDMVVGGISYMVNPRSAQTELAALTDSELLATLPW